MGMRMGTYDVTLSPRACPGTWEAPPGGPGVCEVCDKPVERGYKGAFNAVTLHEFNCVHRQCFMDLWDKMAAEHRANCDASMEY